MLIFGLGDTGVGDLEARRRRGGVDPDDKPTDVAPPLRRDPAERPWPLAVLREQGIGSSVPRSTPATMPTSTPDATRVLGAVKPPPTRSTIRATAVVAGSARPASRTRRNDPKCDFCHLSLCGRCVSNDLGFIDKCNGPAAVSNTASAKARRASITTAAMASSVPSAATSTSALAVTVPSAAAASSKMTIWMTMTTTTTVVPTGGYAVSSARTSTVLPAPSLALNVNVPVLPQHRYCRTHLIRSPPSSTSPGRPSLNVTPGSPPGGLSRGSFLVIFHPYNRTQ